MGKPVVRRKAFSWAAAEVNSSAFFIPPGVEYGSIGFDFGVKSAVTIHIQRYRGAADPSLDGSAVLAPAAATGWDRLYTMQAVPADPLAVCSLQGANTVTYFTAWLGNTTVGALGLPPGWYRFVASAAPGANTSYVVYAGDEAAQDTKPV